MAMALMLGPINAAAVDSGAADAGDVLTADGAGGAAWQAPQGGGGGVPYLVYVALLTQSGENAPVATVLENTLGGNLIWAYQSPGNIEATLMGAFPSGKTFVFCQKAGINEKDYEILRTSDNTIALLNDSGDVSTIHDRAIEIRVYP